MKGLRKAGAWLLAAAWLLTAAYPVSAASVRHEQDLTLVVRNEPVLERDNADPAFWEWPELAGGQSRSGKLTLHNPTAYTVRFRLEGVELPYEDREVLTYLNFVTVTLRAGERELFRDRFVRLADFSCELGEFAPEENLELTVDMSCDYAYSGELTAVKSAVLWQFSARIESAGDVSSPVRGPQLAVAVAVAAVLVVCVCLVLKYGGRKKKKREKTS